MYHARIKKAFDELNISRKQFAEKAQLSEKTIKRILDNPDYQADFDTMQRFCEALNLNMYELFADADVVLVRKEDLAEMEAAKQFVDASKELSAENAELRESINKLKIENESLKATLKQKLEIISIHESYKILLDGLARIITETNTDTQ